MDFHETRPDFIHESAVTCDICGAAISLGAEYINIAAEDESGAIIGMIVAHPACAEHLDPDEILSLLSAAVGRDKDDLDHVLPLDRCCLCGGRIEGKDYINLIEPMHPGSTAGPLVATTFHLVCFRDDPDGVQRALDEEVMQQRARREDPRD